jgi:hypothetical protein
MPDNRRRSLAVSRASEGEPWHVLPPDTTMSRWWPRAPALCGARGDGGAWSRESWNGWYLEHAPQRLGPQMRWCPDCLARVRAAQAADGAS